MVHWKAKIKVSDLWTLHRSGEIETYELAHELADRLKHTLPGAYQTDYQFESIVDELADFHEEDTVDNFDYLLDQLYDWADEDHRLWIETLGE